MLTYRHIAAIVASEEECASRDLNGLTKATHREMHEAALLLLFCIEEVHQESCE